MDIANVRAHFDAEASHYDARILRIVPGYREQSEILLSLLPFTTNTAIRVLDLGCGTGALSSLILSAFPAATVSACDLAEPMLDICRQRLAPYSPRASFQRADFSSTEFGNDEFDAVVSGLAIHHLDAAQTKDLYKRIYSTLRPGGMFLNRELVLGQTQLWTRRYEQLWRDHVAAGGEQDSEWFQSYLDEDQPAAVDDHFIWLRQAEFEDVACHYRRLNFAIFGGSKRAT